MTIIDDAALFGFVLKTAKSASDVAEVVRNLFMDVRDCYRPGLHYMRGLGLKRRTNHQAWLVDSEAVPLPGQHQPPPVYIPPLRRGKPGSITRPRF
ncbi:hypothetical protein ABIB85_004701 [Bradyrhizobium sp. JR1.5]|uniref:hypothetical protein n=1 Tax=unclassified Bradyrhizobium TaxID=2631580 RepID=UPI003398994A